MDGFGGFDVLGPAGKAPDKFLQNPKMKIAISELDLHTKMKILIWEVGPHTKMKILFF